MTNEERKIIVAALDTIEAELHLLGARLTFAGNLLKHTKPEGYPDYEKSVGSAFPEPLAACAQTIQHLRKALRKNADEVTHIEGKK